MFSLTGSPLRALRPTSRSGKRATGLRGGRWGLPPEPEAPAPRRDLKDARHLRWDGNKRGCRAGGGEPGAEVRDAVAWKGSHREHQRAPSRPSDPTGALDGRFLCKEGGGVGRTAPHRGAANVPLPSSAPARAGGLGSRSRKCSHPARKSRAGSPPRRFTRTRDLLLGALATWASRPRRGARGRDALPGVHTPTAAPVRVRTAPLRPRRGVVLLDVRAPAVARCQSPDRTTAARAGVARCQSPDCTTAAQAGVVVLRWRPLRLSPWHPPERTTIPGGGQANRLKRLPLIPEALLSFAFMLSRDSKSSPNRPAVVPP